MAKITNAGKQPRAFFVASKGDYVELDKGQSVDLAAADLEALKASPAFVGSCGPGALVVEGDDGEEIKISPAKAKGKGGRKAKPKAEAPTGGETKPDDDGEEDGEDDEGEPGSNG